VFERDVLPILTEHCSKCHNQHTAQAGLDLSTEATVLKGSQNGPVIVKGSSEKSFLFQRVSSHTMPPPGTEKPLDEAQIEALRKWIDSIGGNEQPAAKEPKAPASESNIPEVSDKDRQFWAFRKPERSAVPKTKNTQRVRTPIDAFLLSKLEARALTFSPEAPKLTLLRRATFDLLGLPPPLEEAQAFLADTRPDAYERLVDRLLASPHYGERWGRHWLDAAGYTDEQGFANDLKTVVFNEGIWRYRDYVVRSFNQDKPYDQFLTEQLAGDELVDWRTAPKYTPEILDSLIATGYLRTAMDLTDAPEVNHQPYYFDVLTRLVDNFSSGILGLTGGCARCHSHKYDPIPQQDYYRLMAIFATGYNPDEWMQPKDRFLPDVSKAEQEEIARFNAEIDRPLNELKKQLEDLRHPHEQRLFESKLAAAVPEPLRADVKTAFETPEKKRTDIQKYFFKKLESLLKVSPEEVDKALSESERATSAKFQGKIATLTGWRRSFDKVQALWDVGKPPKTHLFRRGNWETPGMEVKPGFFSVLSEPGKSQAARPADTKGDSSGCRLALARWLTRRDHPLTARVMVNRVWMHHFGKGIVATPENFGRAGSPPTHPELLDWLAVDFMENGWKLKRLHKLIMTSTAYRQSSRQPPEGQESMAEKVDSSNDLLWRMNLRRIEAEVVRDSVLAVSGKLDQTPGGPPIHLEGAADGLVTVSEKDVSPNGLWRRSLYLMARRNYSLSLLDVFDFPVMALNCTRRMNSATPLQSLTLLNSEFTMQRAEDFAVRVNGLAGPSVPIEKKVEMAFLLALARKPTAEETRWSASHFEKQRQRYLGLKSSAEQSSQKALASLCQMLLGTNEFLYVE
jgi:Protein of unknown function (DUF1553)/Protein of unknown function (DUF1549)/Planctomycete cytochrome C